MPRCYDLCWTDLHRAICSWLAGRHEHAQALNVSRAHLGLYSMTHGLLQPTSAYNFALAAGLKLSALTARGALLVTVRRKSASAGLFIFATSPSILVRFLQSKAPLLESQCTPISAVTIKVMLCRAAGAASKCHLGPRHWLDSQQLGAALGRIFTPPQRGAEVICYSVSYASTSQHVLKPTQRTSDSSGRFGTTYLDAHASDEPLSWT